MQNNTRNKNILLRIPKVKLQMTKKSFYFSGAKYFNELHAHVRGAENIEMFLKFFDL